MRTEISKTDIARLYCRLNCYEWPAELRKRTRSSPFVVGWRKWLVRPLWFLLRRYIADVVEHAETMGAMKMAEHIAGEKEVSRVWNTEHCRYQPMTNEEFEKWWATGRLQTEYRVGVPAKYKGRSMLEYFAEYIRVRFGLHIVT